MTDGGQSWPHDLAAGSVTAAVGLAAILIAKSYGVGTLQRMEPGFFPVAIGVVLVAIGVVLCVGALKLRAREPRGSGTVIAMPDWRGWFFIVGGVVAFLVLGAHGGLLPAAFGCVFISALGTRTMTWQRALILALCVSIPGSMFFSYVLKVQMPLLTSGLP